MTVKEGEYLTIAEMAKILETDISTVKKRLFRAKIKPLARDALYPISALEIIKKTPSPGRPAKKPKEPDTSEPPEEDRKAPDEGCNP
jgi:hypothetical protein